MDVERRRSCLVTGGSGFVARRLIQMLERIGVEVWSTGRGATGLRSIAWPDVAASPAPVDRRFDHVLHLAALTDLAACNADPGRAIAVNAHGARHAVDLAAKVGASILYLSTLGVYGDPQYFPIDEEHPTAPIEAYSVSKLRGEEVTIAEATALGVSWTVVRSFNVYGPGQGPGRIVPDIVSQALGSDTIVVRDTESTRDFVYVEDLCEAIWGVAASTAIGIFNVGSGIETSIGQLVLAVGDVLGRQLAVEVRRGQPYPDVKRSQAGIDKIARTTGWVPSTTLARGLRATIEMRLGASSNVSARTGP